MDMATMPSRQLILRRRGYALEKGQATPAPSSALLPPGCGTMDRIAPLNVSSPSMTDRAFPVWLGGVAHCE